MNRLVRVALPAVVLVALAGWALWEFVLEVESPDEVTTSAALEQLTEDLVADDDPVASATEGEAASGTAAADDQPDSADFEATGVVGVWSVDDDFGDFAFENASGSFAGFRVDKELFVGGVQTAVGRSGDVAGSIEIGDGAVVGGEIVVDMSTIQSDQARRESAILDAVDADAFPTATFSIAGGTALDTDGLASGATVGAGIDGELTIAGTTNPVTIAAEATVVEPGLALIVGTADLVWADYGVETPSSTAGTVADEGILEFQLIVRLS